MSKHPGPPTVRSQELADEIVESLMEGFSMIQICNRPHMPNRSTILRWMNDDNDFATRCAQARELQADLMDDMIMELINNTTPETSKADRIKLAAMQWRAEKLKPKKYGNKVAQEISGPNSGPIQHETVIDYANLTDEELAVLEKLAKKQGG
jgi:hypothetical protein